jgi:diguanylate cyclase (GGDEF)-like protein/PAS domain S-box-containing protein
MRKLNSLRTTTNTRLAHTHVPPIETSPRSIDGSLHKLHAYQIELETQNDELRRAHIALEKSRDRYVNLYEFAPVGYLTLTREGLIDEINLTGATLLGVKRKKLINRNFTVLVAPEDSDRWRLLFSSMMQHEEEKLNFELMLRRSNHSLFHAQLNCLLVATDNQAPIIRITLADITERKLTEERIRQLIFYDPLTRLPNRLLLQERLKHDIDVERRVGKQLALLMLDLDLFKAVNDSLGHQAGDELLQQVAERITTRLRVVDMVARLGGDEFVVLLEDIINPQDAARVAEEIIVDLNKPFKLIQCDDVRIGVSIGICLYPQHGDSLEMLLEHADAAMYRAKNMGRGCFAYFSEELTITACKRIELETRLRRAIPQHELRVFYQPQMDVVSGRIIGAEALVRWQDPVEGLIQPSHFISIAEETHLIVEIGEWVLRETCNQGRQWLADGLPSLILGVNVSPYQFRRSDICALVAAVLAETGFPAEQLELEITESGLMENQKNATNILNNLRDQGIHLAIDDFGTGYSSLAHLKHFPLDVLKIDKSFIDEIPHNKDDMEIAATIVAMGHILGFKVLAEGVETLEQLAFLHKNGCDSYQGFIKSCPLPAEEFAKLLRSQQRGE